MKLEKTAWPNADWYYKISGSKTPKEAFDFVCREARIAVGQIFNGKQLFGIDLKYLADGTCLATPLWRSMPPWYDGLITEEIAGVQT